MLGSAGLFAGVAVAGLLGTRWLVHWGFRAPRVVETQTPAAHGLPFSTVSIATVGGRRLFGWLVPGLAGGPSSGRGMGPAVVMMHGWGANAQALLPLAAPLHRAGWTVLLVDARNHGQSDGDSFSSMPRFAEDLEHAFDWLRSRPSVDPDAVALLGHSVGGAAALLVASRRTEPVAVVSLSAFDHPETVMRAVMGRWRVPYRPVGWLVNRYVERVIGHRFDAIAPVSSVARIACPVLVAHGAEDRSVPPASAHAIHARRSGEHVEVLILEGAGHDHAPCFDTVGRALAGFLDRAVTHRRSGGLAFSA